MSNIDWKRAFILKYGLSNIPLNTPKSKLNKHLELVRHKSQQYVQSDKYEYIISSEYITVLTRGIGTYVYRLTDTSPDIHWNIDRYNIYCIVIWGCIGSILCTISYDIRYIPNIKKYIVFYDYESKNMIQLENQPGFLYGVSKDDDCIYTINDKGELLNFSKNNIKVTDIENYDPIISNELPGFFTIENKILIQPYQIAIDTSHDFKVYNIETGKELLISYPNKMCKFITHYSDDYYFIYRSEKNIELWKNSEKVYDMIKEIDDEINISVFGDHIYICNSSKEFLFNLSMKDHSIKTYKTDLLPVYLGYDMGLYYFTVNDDIGTVYKTFYIK